MGSFFFKLFTKTQYGAQFNGHSFDSPSGKRIKKEMQHKFARTFKTHIGLMMTANVGHLVADPSKHDLLLKTFVHDDVTRTHVSLLLKKWAAINRIMRSKNVSDDDIASFQDRMTGAGDGTGSLESIGFCRHVHGVFPELHCPDYLHMLMDHGYSILCQTRGTGFYCEEPSEAINHLIHSYFEDFARPKAADAFLDVLRRLYLRSHFSVRERMHEELSKKTAKKYN